MGAANEVGEIVRLGKEHAELKPVAEAAERLASTRAERADLEVMASASDPEMAGLAREELDALSGRIDEIEHDLAVLLAPRDADENASA
ncbi:MAG: peptide chain release factor 1, partial [Caulobacteraceae bacterium]|nr:peptide chain release factor 1 [Caulobacteraceae bacterium]